MERRKSALKDKPKDYDRKESESRRESEGESSTVPIEKKRSKVKKDKAEELEERFKAARLSTTSTTDFDSKGRWGWKGNRSMMDITSLSTDISVDRRRSTVVFGTATSEPSDYHYSILHKYKRFSTDNLPPGEEGQKEKESQEQDGEKGKVTESWKWKREEKDQGADEKKEGQQGDEDGGKEEQRKDSVSNDEKKETQRDSLKSEVPDKPQDKLTPKLQQHRKSVLPSPSVIGLGKSGAGGIALSKVDKYVPGSYQVLRPDAESFKKLGALDASKQTKVKAPPSKEIKKPATVKFQPKHTEHKIPPSKSKQVQPPPKTPSPHPPRPGSPKPKPPPEEAPEEKPIPELPKPKSEEKPAPEPSKPKPEESVKPIKPKPPAPPTDTITAPSKKPLDRLSLETSYSDTSTSGSTDAHDLGRTKSRHRRRRKPRPSDSGLTEFDIDDELSSSLSDEYTAAARRSRASLSTHEDPHQKHPDDELLFTLTAKEEIVFRKGISEMRWEEEESLSEEASGYTTGGESSSDLENTAASVLWDRINSGKTFTIPIITVNDRRISLGHLDPESPEDDEEPGEKQKYDKVFQPTESVESVDSDDTVQAIFDLLDEAEAKKKEYEQEEDKKASARAKLWRRRLIVVVLLNFVMKSRRPFVAFCELLVPILVCGVVVSGMIRNSAGYTEALQENVAELQEAFNNGFNPFERIGSEEIFTAFCSNEEFCSKGSRRHYYIVYSPTNKFTHDIMLRTLKFMRLELPPESTDHDHVGKSPSGPAEEHNEEDHVSKLIGVKNASEVERTCREHWNEVSKFDGQKDTDGSDIFERELNKRRAESRLVRYPIGIIFSMEGNLIGADRLKRIENDEDIPKSLTYTIRTFFPEVANTVEGFPFRELRRESGAAKGQRHFQSTPYLHTGIIGLQLALDFAFAEKIVEKAEYLDPYMLIGSTKTSRRYFFHDFLEKPALQQFEYPTYKDPNLRYKGWLALTMAIVFSYVVGDILVSQDVVHEQNSGTIELLKIHGMTTSMRWIANLIILGVLRSITTLAMALIIHYQIAIKAVAEFSHPMFLWLFLWMHACTMTCFNYFITSGLGVKKPELAGLIVVCVSFVTLLSPLHLFVEGYLSRFANVTLCFLLPQWNLANGIYYYLRFELYHEGLDWYDFPVLVDTDTNLIIALPLSCNIFLYSTMFYLMLTIYMDHILPREFSPRETWLFCCKSFTRRPPSESEATRHIPRSQKPSVYEVGPRDAAYGPRFRNVTVTNASNKVTVLDNISLDMYEGEVTCIVGQIGSGKSDFLNVIAGVNVPSSGFVDVKGLRVHDYHDITNRYVSLCPQRRLLIETLSVEDHIRLCCMLHGSSYATAKTQATFLLKMFGLMSMRRHSYTGLTTNDIKKVMLAMALSKSPSVLLLDNPIDQLDSESRFQFWKLLQELKSQRSIVVTCTNLEEAQLYGDRIAILSKGKLVCYGSPMYIRLAYAIGNVMTLRLGDGVEPDIWTMQQMMHRELRGAKTHLLETKGVSLQVDTLKFVLPFGKFYGGVLEKMEDNMERFGITKILMSQPSLWAVYQKIALHPGIEQVLAKREIRMLRGTNEDDHEGIERAVDPQVPVQKEAQAPNHGVLNIISVLVLKKYWYYKQKYYVFLFAYLPQIILVMLVVGHAQLFLITEPEGLSKVVSTRMYQNNYIVFRSADNENTRKGWEEAFIRVLSEDDDDARIEIFDYQDDIEAYLQQGKAHTLTHFQKQTIVAFSKDKKSHLGYYSSNSIHSAPIAAHIMMQAFLYVISPDREEPYGTALVTNPFTQYRGFPAGSTQSNSSTILGLFLSLILCLLSAPLLRMILTERSSKFKTIQRMTGVSAWIYWSSHGIADCILYIILTALCWFTVIFLDNIEYQQFDGWEERLALMIIFMTWLCWTALPYTYLLGCLLSNQITGYGHYILLHFMFGIIPKIVTYQFFRLEVEAFFTWLRYFLYIFPPYSITSACVHFFHVVGDERWCRNVDTHACELYANVSTLLRTRQIKELFDLGDQVEDFAAKFLINKISFNDTFRTCCRAYCEDAGTCHDEGAFLNILSLSKEEVVIPHLKEDIIALFVNGVAFWILVLLHEQEILQSVWSFFTSKVCGNLELTVAQRDVKTSDEAEDVKLEHQKVDYMVEIEGDVDSEAYLVQDVTKFYKYTKGLDHVYFSVPVNAITGLLGLPKCGKTTVLELLTCQLAPSSGYIYKDNDLLDGKTKKYLMMRVGYCPQKPCTIGYLTGSQMLTVMGRLRGLSKRECDQHVIAWIQLFELGDVANKKCSTYTKGQEQRLCCALALIGDTNMVILDEPTASMDNLERYIFWNVMNLVPKAMSRTVLFASINADEVQNQSSKALLMEAGSLVAVGHLTEIFKNNNQGMTLAIRYGFPSYKKYSEFQRKAKLDRLKDHVIQFLSPCALLDEHDNLLIYHLKDQNLKLSRVYAVMEGAKVRFTTLLEHFQVNEPSLDDIIFQFHKARLKRQSEKTASEEPSTVVGGAASKDKANSVGHTLKPLV